MDGPRFDVFLSYNSDDEPVALELAERLKQTGVNPWFAMWHVPPGLTWMEQIELGMSQCASCAVLVGPSGLGRWQNEEMRIAIDRRVNEPPFAVIAVLLPSIESSVKGKLPPLLLRSTWVEFAATLDEPATWNRLVTGIRGLDPELTTPVPVAAANSRSDRAALKATTAAGSETAPSQATASPAATSRSPLGMKLNYGDFIEVDIKLDKLLDQFTKQHCEQFMSELMYICYKLRSAQDGLGNGPELISITKSSVIIKVKMQKEDYVRLVTAYRESKTEAGRKAMLEGAWNALEAERFLKFLSDFSMKNITSASDPLLFPAGVAQPEQELVSSIRHAEVSTEYGRLRLVLGIVYSALRLLLGAPARLALSLVRVFGHKITQEPQSDDQASTSSSGTTRAHPWSQPSLKTLQYDSSYHGTWRPTLMDFVVTVALVAICTITLIPPIQSAREAARRVQCINNLKQLGSATHSYLMTCGTYPSGIRYQPLGGNCFTSGSCLVDLSHYFENGTAFNALNVQLNIYDPQNATISGIGFSSLWCPSDPVVAKRTTFPAGTVTSVPLPMRFTSYGADAGEFFIQDVRPPFKVDPVTCETDFADEMPGQQQMNGVIYHLSHVSIASITDGTGNTFLFGERAHGKLRASDLEYSNWWTSGTYGDTMFTTFFGMNVFKKPPFDIDRGPVCSADGGSNEFAASPSSFHPGGANFAFCDGSVKFIKDSTSSWQIDPRSIGTPGIPSPNPPGCLPFWMGRGVKGDPYVYAIPAGTSIGILQQLSTRNGGEVVSADQY